MAEERITRRRLLHAGCLGAAALAMPRALSGAAAKEEKHERPNVLWITSEDNGPFLGCYGDPFAKTPHLDKLASQGVLYLNAVANAPVCAPARSTIITGMYASSIGTHHMRSGNRVARSLKLYPQYLREAGYFCTNHRKTDYNLSGASRNLWDKGRDWAGRKPGQPFFSIINLGTSHESSLHGSRVRPENLKAPFKLPPYHPDTPEIRSNWVQYYQIITRLDSQIGQILAKLDKDGLADDTIVFYYSDHGGILPRSKRFLYDSGMHVPMIVRVPKKHERLAPAKPGTKTDRLVSFVDLPPTLLSLAGIKIPPHMQGTPFLGEQQAPPREFVYGFRGRMDERYDMMRAVRDKRYKYIRNYMPHRILGQHLNYLWRMPATRSWEQAYQQGKCNAAQRAFWEPKPTEELFDLQADPHEVSNLAESPEHQAILERMRKANRDHLLRIRDSGFLPESEMKRRAGGGTIMEMVRDDKRYPLARIMEAAEVAGQRDAESVPRLIEWMSDPDPAIRYWAATGCAVRGAKAAAAAEALRKLLKDDSPPARIAAAEALCLLGKADEGLPALVDALSGPGDLRAINTLEALGDVAKPMADAIAAKVKKAKGYSARAATSLLARLKATK